MITIDQIKDDIISGKSKKVYYSSQTLWWSHLEKDVEQATETGKLTAITLIQNQIESNIPEGQKKILKAQIQSIRDSEMLFDPIGAILLQIDEPTKWISEAEESPKYFGKHELNAFMLCHHQNFKDGCPMKWDEVNNYIDNIKVKQEK